MTLVLGVAPSSQAPDAPPGRPQPPFRIEVTEAASGWPVPLVELRTTGELRWYTDNAGVIAIDAPELMNRETWFFISADGFQVPADGFGYRGVRLTPEPGGSARITVNRTSIARRLGRLTGAGRFAHSRRTLGELPPGLDGADETGVVGCDSVQNDVHRGRLFWIWGDTSLFHYPLGIFHASAATTSVQPIDVNDPVPPIAIDFDYFRDAETRRPRGVAKMPGPGPTWLTGLVSLPDAKGRPRLVAAYAKIRNFLDVYEWGQCVWNEEAERFERDQVAWRADDAPTDHENDDNAQRSATDAAAHDREEGPGPGAPDRPPAGHATLWTDADGEAWVLFGNPFPSVRCRATYEAWLDVANWETLSPPEELSVAGAAQNADDRDGDDDPPLSVTPHAGSIAWHPWREKWVTVFHERGGEPSNLGEVWYAEADSPLGPWSPAVKILSHAEYSFYNPRIHAEWLTADSPVLAFEGTFSQMFADDPHPVPRYDYNQILYRLDLDDPALAPARGE